jgi:formylglycine-generating enzyme required for sulfatase activity
MDHVELLRVVVASPGDVQAERDALPAVIEELNKSVARDRNLRLELARWETDAYPGFHAEGPQGLIDPILQIEDCDVLIGIFWKRFGTPTRDARSGKEHEFRRAYEAWQQHGRPQIMVYFNQGGYAPRSKEETDQWGQVLEFQENFPKEGLWWPYEGATQFERLLRLHLTQFIRHRTGEATSTQGIDNGPTMGSNPVRNLGSGSTVIGPGVGAGAGGIAVGGDVHGNIYVSPSSAAEPPTALRTSYLNWLMEQVRAVPLTGVDPKSIREETRRDLDLAAVYTALMTQRTEAIGAREPHPERDLKHLSALMVLNGEPRLALLGDSGSGKSTFVNFVALCLAGERLGRAEANLTVLRTPMPDSEHGRRGSGESPPPQPWDHGPLLPIRVVLRDFVSRGLTPAGRAVRVSGDTLWQFITSELPETLRDFAAAIRAELLNTGGVLLLDGLDEVPEADQRRVQVKAAVEQFAAVFHKVRILVTSRTYAYQKQEWKLKGFAEATLAPLGRAQIRRFLRRWYAYVGQARGLSPDAAQGCAVLLNHAIVRNPCLYELATCPLLLTLIASLHAWRGGTLPEQREELYADTVELLLDQWEKQKVQPKPDGMYDIIEPSLVEWLHMDQKAMRLMLNRLAFEAHRDQPHLIGTADITQDTLVSQLMRLNLNPDARPARLLEYLRDRAGLLEPRGVGIYAFPHRTFQEYLAACHLTDFGSPDDLADLLQAEPNRWREVVLLAGAKAARGTASAAWNLADALCFRDAPQQPVQEASGYWGALLAAQVLIENKSLEHVVERNRPKLDRIRAWLTYTLQHGALPPVDRAQAGNALANIGDPRFRADAWYLPGDPLLGFVEIPAGAFLMGSDKERDSEAFDDEMPQHKVHLPRYFIGRYPVTVAQFRAFVEDSGYRPGEERCLWGVLNHPVVNVSWEEALNYCDWLTERLRVWPGTPEPLATLLHQNDWRVSLPSEAEWEKAARGSDGRIYPWGAEPDPYRANYDDTNIGTTSAVGCFPGGASSHGIEDVSGNVWEWTRSLWGRKWEKPDYGYPYKANDDRENLQAARDVSRVLRGGAFNHRHRVARCAYRDPYRPHYRFRHLGFRVVVLPCS